MLVRRTLSLSALLALPVFTALGWDPAEPEALASVTTSDGIEETLAALVAQGQGPNAASTCGMCHTEIYAEWKDRGHNKAWVDPIYQEAIAKKTRPALCHACHIPAQVLDRLGSRPRIRDTHLDEGVTCVSCHKKGDVQHGPFGSDTLAHPCEKNPAFSFEGSVSLCASCHSTKIEDVLPVAKDFLDADMASKGKSCIGCHMPEVERQLSISLATGNPVGEVRKGRSHILLGTRDPEFVATAFEFGAARRGDDVVLSIVDMAGHRIPGLALRTFPVEVKQLDGGGGQLRTDSFVISAENGLQAEETRDFTFPMAEGTVAIEVVMDHFLQGEKIATILTRKLDL